MTGGLDRAWAAATDAGDQTSVGDSLVQCRGEEQIAHRAASTDVGGRPACCRNDGGNDRFEPEGWDSSAGENRLDERPAIRNTVVVGHIVKPGFRARSGQASMQSQVDRGLARPDDIAKARPQPLGGVKHEAGATRIELDVPRHPRDLLWLDDFGGRDGFEEIGDPETPLELTADPCQPVGRLGCVVDPGENVRVVGHDRPSDRGREVHVEAFPKPRCDVKANQIPARPAEARNQVNDDHGIDPIDPRRPLLHETEGRSPPHTGAPNVAFRDPSHGPVK